MSRQRDVEQNGRPPAGDDALERRLVIAALAAAGIVGPVLFTVGVLVQQFYRRGAYDPIAQLVSDLTAGPYGWVQQVNFVVFGLLVIAFAVGLQLGVRPARAGVVGPAIVGFNGVGLVVGGIFPLREDAAGLVYDPIGVHTVNGVIFFLSIGIVLVVVSLRLRGDPRWRGLAIYTLVTGIALLVLFVVLVALARPADAPLHDWFGLMQRLVLVVWFACIVVLALRLLRVARAADEPRGSTTGTPRWVKVFGIIVAVLVLLFVVVLLFGGNPPGDHGPGRHTPSGGAGGQTPPSTQMADSPAYHDLGAGGDETTGEPIVIGNVGTTSVPG